MAEGARRWVYGFLSLGVSLGLTGSMLIAWQYHLGVDPALIGLHFLALNAGYLLAGLLAPAAARRMQIRVLAMVACIMAFACLLLLPIAAPPVAVGWRLAGLSVLGASAALLTSSLLYVLEDSFTRLASHTANLTGALFGCGCTLATVTVGMTYFAGSVQLEIGLLSSVPAVFCILFWRSKFPPARQRLLLTRDREEQRQAARELRSVAAALFSLLLFFQFGNEWVIGGWLPLALVQRLGANPVEAIFCLALYFLALTVGRLAVRWLLPRVKHTRLLYGSLVVSMAGYVLLSFAPSIALAAAASLAIGFGHAPVYPIVAETLDSRFSYHPGFYQAVCSVAITGAMSAPWLVGYLYGWLGAESIILLPVLGSIAVMALALLIRWEARLMRSEGAAA